MIKLAPNIRPLIGWTLFALVMLALPQFVSNGTLRIIIFANFLAIFAMSWDFISGKTGYISFGHPFLIGIGAYTSAILSYRFGVPVSLSIFLAVLATMIGGTLFFLPALRIKGTYFALVTLAFMELMYQLIQVVRPDLTGGTRGISGVKTILTGAQPNFYLSFCIMFVIAVVLWWLSRTRLGTALDAISMNEEAVSGSGLNTTKLKLFAFMVSAAVAGLGGAFYVHYLGSIAPRALFDINFVFTIIVSALIGGSSTIIGPILGAFFMTFLLEYLRPFLPGSERYFAYGMIALVLYVYQPKALWRFWQSRQNALAAKQRERPAMSSLLELDNVVKRFGGITATDGLSFHVEKGESLALIGPNGAGKTTIFSLIMGEHRQNSGSIKLKGEEVSGLPTYKRIQKGVARTYQVPRPFPQMNVAGNIRVGMMPDSLWQMISKAPDPDTELAIAKSVGFRDEDLCRLPSTLSMGDLRKLELARTLATKPDIMLLDEVFAGLTVGEIEQISQLLAEKRKEGLTYVIVSHDLRALEPLVDRAVAMTFGKAIAEGSFTQVMSDQAVRAAYLGQ